MNCVKMDFSEFSNFFDKIGKAGDTDFKKAMKVFLEGLGTEFLTIVENEIIRREVVDTRLLLHSFTRGSQDNIWLLTEGNFSLEIGTNLEYASFVNDGHWTCEKGEKMRFVPGEFRGGKFIYIKGCKTGMILKQKWITARPYFDGALRTLERIYPEYLEKALQNWIDNYFR